MAKVLILIEHMVARFPAGTFARIGAVLRDGENRATFVREAVNAETERRAWLERRACHPAGKELQHD